MTLPHDKRLLVALAQALALRRQGQIDQAEQLASTVVRIEPRFLEAQTFLAHLAMDRGDKTVAIKRFTKAMLLAPGQTETMFTLAHLRHEEQFWEEAAVLFTFCRLFRGGVPSFHLQRGRVQQSLEQSDAAIRSFKRASVLEPSAIEPLIGLANTLMWTGRLAVAKRLFYRCWRMDPERPELYGKILELDRGNIQQQVLEKLHGLLETTDLPVRTRRLLHFSAADDARDRKAFPKAFHHLAEGHRARADHLGHHYDGQTERDLIRQFEELFSKERLAGLRLHLPSALAPIFIVGMPRSGTTLTEQILASHSQVGAAGELPAMSAIHAQVFDQDRPPVTREMIRTLSPEHLAPLAQSYLDFLAPFADGARFVTDKMPHNFIFLWLITAMFPNAPIVHCTRNPVDNCLSIYQQDFETGHAYSDDLRSLGHHYRHFYREIMALWGRVLERPLLTFKYEDLVENPEEKVRELLQYCGLPFEPECLSFEGAERMVRTASVTQVRRGIYKTSSGRWREVESELGPLFDALGEIALEA